jgi:hypothetical protein
VLPVGTLSLWYSCFMPGRSWHGKVIMSDINWEGVIDNDAVDKLTDEQVATVLSILTKAGY